MDDTEWNVGNNVGKQLNHIRIVFLLPSDHGIRLVLATEIGMESKDSDHTSLMINCPIMTSFAALAPYDDEPIYGIREQKLTINWCTRADISRFIGYSIHFPRF